MQENARRIAKVCKESKLPVVEEEYVQSFKVELMDAVVQWCRGASFADICKVGAHSLNVRHLAHAGASYVAHRPVRGQPHSRFPAAARAHSSDGPGCQSHWKHRAQTKVRKCIRDARAAEFRHLCFIVISLSWRSAVTISFPSVSAQHSRQQMIAKNSKNGNGNHSPEEEQYGNSIHRQHQANSTPFQTPATCQIFG